ncbi:MAG: hypothetical protein U0132_09030 [Gemmatimonadaceae bacterium]
MGQRRQRQSTRPRIRTRPDPQLAARDARLRYVNADGAGIRRLGTPSRFRYLAADGHPIRDRGELQRIRQLAIPPAWKDVWICAYPNGHLQATGRDARGRKQYRYHPRWRVVRDANKYASLLDFGNALERIRTQVETDLTHAGFPREKVLAMLVRLLETTFVRVGNESYARENGSFGLTTLKNRHVRLARSGLRLLFRGKSGVRHDVMVTDRRLARLVQRCRELPGQDLFQYLDADGAPQPISSTDVNEYLKAAAGAEFTAKDFRTWAGTLLAVRYLSEHAGELDGDVPAKTISVALVKHVADSLRNTPAVCRSCYIHPLVLNAISDASHRKLLRQALNGRDEQSDDRQWEEALRRFLRAEQAAERRDDQASSG